VFILNKSPSKGKFDVRGLEGIFVGYSEVSKAYRVWSPKDRKIHIARDVKFFNEFYTTNSVEDIITEETKNGRFNIEDNLETMEEPRDTDIANSRNPVTASSESQQTDNNIETEREDEGATPAKRTPGRPKGATNKKPDIPTRQYNLRSSKNQLPDSMIVESSSDDDVEWHDSRYALFAGDIYF